MKNIEEFYNYSRKNIFFTGSEYVDYIENKEEKDRKWYETFYLWYYNNGIYLILIVGLILIILMCFDKYCKNNYNNDSQKIKKIQIGGEEGNDDLDSIKNEAEKESNAKANKNEQKNSKKSEGQGKSKFLYKKGIRKKAYNMGKLSDENARKLKLRAERFKKGFKAGLGPLYKFLFAAFIVFAFGAFIMPTIIMFIISAITFFITKSQIQRTLTT